MACVITKPRGGLISGTLGRTVLFPSELVSISGHPLAAPVTEAAPSPAASRSRLLLACACISHPGRWKALGPQWPAVGCVSPPGSSCGQALAEGFPRGSWTLRGRGHMWGPLPGCHHITPSPAPHRTPASTLSSPTTPRRSPAPSTTSSSLTRTAPTWCL